MASAIILFYAVNKTVLLGYVDDMSQEQEVSFTLISFFQVLRSGSLR